MAQMLHGTFFKFINNLQFTNLRSEKNDERKNEPTWIQEIFQGTLTNETKCLNCETVL